MGGLREEVTINKKAPRQSGIELLRIIAVTLITAHHLVVHSGYPLFNEPISVRRLFFSDVPLIIWQDRNHPIPSDFIMVLG